MGSANFNDRFKRTFLFSSQLYFMLTTILVLTLRSMLGERDSEMAIRIEDTDHVAIRMNGVPFYVGRLPHKLRTTLMRRHLGDSSIGMLILYALFSSVLYYMFFRCYRPMFNGYILQYVGADSGSEYQYL